MSEIQIQALSHRIMLYAGRMQATGSMLNQFKLEDMIKEALMSFDPVYERVEPSGQERHEAHLH